MGCHFLLQGIFPTQGLNPDLLIGRLYLLSPQGSIEQLHFHFRASLVAQRIKHLPAVWETWVRSLGQEDTLEKEMATHSGTLAWNIPWMEKPGRLQSIGPQSVRQSVGHD